MNTLTVLAFACLAVIASAKPSGHGAWGAGAWGGWGGHGAWGGHGVDAVVAPGVAVVGPAASAAGLGVGLGVGGWGAGWGGWGAGHGHGVAVVGPATVPATIVGPAGKIVADGLYGVGPGSFGHGGHGHW